MQRHKLLREITIVGERMTSLQLVKLRPLANIFWDSALEVIVTYLLHNENTQMAYRIVKLIGLLVGFLGLLRFSKKLCNFKYIVFYYP